MDNVISLMVMITPPLVTRPKKAVSWFKMPAALQGYQIYDKPCWRLNNLRSMPEGRII